MRTMRTALLIITFFVSSSVFADHSICERALSAIRSLVSPSLHLFKASSKRELAYEYRAGSRRQTMVFLHGLGDDMTHMEGLAEKAQADGFPVLRVDLHGHGATLFHYFKTHAHSLPTELSYMDNVEDLKELIVSLKLKEVSLVGHSYGGGIAFSLASELEQSTRVKVHSLHMLAPYVQRIDKFFSAYFRSPEFLLDTAADLIERGMVGGAIVRSIMDPFLSMVRTMNDQMRYFKDQMSRYSYTDLGTELVMQPFVEQFMRTAYRRYFVLIHKKTESELTKEESQLIDLKVEGAIKVTKGIRSFDLLDQSKPLPKIKATVHVMGGRQDSLVIPAQLDEFARRMYSADLTYRLDYMTGEKSHHLFPRTQTDSVYRKILAFH